MSHRRHTSLPKKKSYRSRCKDRRYESNSSSSSDFSRSRKSSVSRDSDNISLSDKEEQNFLSELQAVGQSINQNTSKQNSGNGNSNDNNTLSSESKKCLKDLFGEYASVKKTEKRIGLNLMTLRKKLLKTVYVPRHLVFYHVFLKRRKSGLFFPTSEETEEFLQVPPLDKLLESCLIKNYGAKGSFTKNNSRSLVTQPCKKIEHIAYKGQQASRMGIIMTSYVQQSLATLLDLLVEDNWDKDKVITNVKNVFAMTTQQLDQFGRTGAFHHIIRRTAAMTDSKLYELDDAIDLANIPLSGKGVFGPDFDTFLKDRKEKKKQIDEIIPDFKKKDNKRKLHSDTRSKVKKRDMIISHRMIIKDKVHLLALEILFGTTESRKKMTTNSTTNRVNLDSLQVQRNQSTAPRSRGDWENQMTRFLETGSI
ncbi:uncharacterized protein LOC123557756 isoform X2 [Mercenaria mercenaria]|uniref:uncharacterized protein LOC123557756 isoform X2 n=1 Tax=Mercenaria mercenaria TaxID=6596 RepID=UPI00234EC752|nr:uncharacterized protein LOC123557756 isoform X2 [Mercenaria mercenaria]XP_053381579.1 uncharacterized protein LOC123557756 isoform X2 [Mercenaria mercenaria]XP_053381580.1 uncharacterized protein LOC123557756 isoform X2 [Mercenaria mercenaria]